MLFHFIIVKMYRGIRDVFYAFSGTASINGMNAMRGKGNKIKSVSPGSIADELRLSPGDILLSVNNRDVNDILDYHFLTQAEVLEVLIEKSDGEEWLLEIEKDEDEDLGLTFESGLLDDYHHCRNRCIFCFIDQLPKGMRKTLYFKDDDTRLSFLQGNYVTLTNTALEDLDRVIEYRLSPINVSVHTTDSGLRCRMLGNPHAGDILEKMRKLGSAGIEMNAQIVLCKGINDKEELTKTLNDLRTFLPQMRSVAVVPVGITRYREGLYPLEAPDAEYAKDALARIEAVQEQCLQSDGTRFVYASDELILLAGADLPEEEAYEGYPQLENGVGMLRLFMEEAEYCLEEMAETEVNRSVSIATGVLAAPFIRKMAEKVRKKAKGLTVNVYGIRNDFFGSRITVSGLITGRDIMTQLAGRDVGERLLIPVNMLRAGEDVFLDDVTVEELEETLHTEVFITDNDGHSFLSALTGEERPVRNSWRQIYEQTDRSNCRET